MKRKEVEKSKGGNVRCTSLLSMTLQRIFVFFCQRLRTICVKRSPSSHLLQFTRNGYFWISQSQMICEDSMLSDQVLAKLTVQPLTHQIQSITDGKMKNKHIKEIMGVKGKPDIIHIKQKKRLQWYGHVKRMPRGENIRTNHGLDTAGEKEKRTPKKNVDGRSISSHDNKKFRIRAMEKQRGMAFGFQKTATAVKKRRTVR